MWLTKLTVLIAHAILKSFVQLDFIHQLEMVSAMMKLTLPRVAMMVETVVGHIQTKIIALIALAMVENFVNQDLFRPQLEMVFVMMIRIIKNVITVVVTVVDFVSLRTIVQIVSVFQEVMGVKTLTH